LVYELIVKLFEGPDESVLCVYLDEERALFQSLDRLSIKGKPNKVRDRNEKKK
jgi:hypothetical protein